MRNDIKPIIPRRRKGSAIGGAYGLKESPEGRGVPGNGSGFDAERGSSVRRERGDATDPAGPKRSTTTSASGAQVVVTDASGTNATVSRSNDRTSTTTGKLRDRDLERSARMSAEPDVRALDIPLGDSSEAVPIIMAVGVGVVALLGFLLVMSFVNVSATAVAVVIGLGVIVLLGVAWLTRVDRPLMAVACVVLAVLLALMWLLGFVGGSQTTQPRSDDDTLRVIDSVRD